jgi:hypothetical protein
MHALRRLFPGLGLLTTAGFAWNHRASLVRLFDLVLDGPRLVREDGAAGIARHGRVLLELDRVLPTATDVRISGMEDGSVTLAGDPGPIALARATEALCGLPGVVDVRTDGSTHPVVADALA